MGVRVLEALDRLFVEAAQILRRERLQLDLHEPPVLGRERCRPRVAHPEETLFSRGQPSRRYWRA